MSREACCWIPVAWRAPEHGFTKFQFNGGRGKSHLPGYLSPKGTGGNRLVTAQIDSAAGGTEPPQSPVRERSGWMRPNR
jgi:hypothetical protein